MGMRQGLKLELGIVIEDDILDVFAYVEATSIAGEAGAIGRVCPSP